MPQRYVVFLRNSKSMPVIRHTCLDSPVVGDVVASGLFGACIRPEEKAQPEQDYAYA